MEATYSSNQPCTSSKELRYQNPFLQAARKFVPNERLPKGVIRIPDYRERQRLKLRKFISRKDAFESRPVNTVECGIGTSRLVQFEHNGN